MTSFSPFNLEPMLCYNIVQSLAHMNLEMKVMINTDYYAKFVLCVNNCVLRSVSHLWTLISVKKHAT